MPQGPTFKAQVEYVEVDAVVTDDQGNFVRNLKRDDFQVSEDGKPQNISTFLVVDIPVERYERPLFAEQPIEPDVKSNEHPFDGRVYVLILDDLHVDATRTSRVRQYAAAVHRAQPRRQRPDGGHFHRRSVRRRAGLHEQQAAAAGLGRQVHGPEAGVADAVQERPVLPPGGRRSDPRVDDPLDMERAHNATNMLSTLRQVAEWLGGIHGRRKSMLFISEGIDYDLNDVIRKLRRAAQFGQLDHERHSRHGRR